MSDIIKEVKEELRRERNQRSIRKISMIFVTVAIVSVVVVAGMSWSKSQQKAKNIESSNKYYAIADVSTAEARLKDIITTANNGYRDMSYLKLAGLHLFNKDYQDALDIYDTVVKNTNIDILYRHIAQIRAINIVVNYGIDTASIETRLSAISPEHAFYYSSVESRINYLLSQNKVLEARNAIDEAVKDISMPVGMSARLKKIAAFLAR